MLGESSSLFHSVQWGRAVPGPIEAVFKKMQNVLRLGKTLALAASVAAAMAVRAEALQFEYVTSFGTQGSAEGQFEYVEDFAFTRAGQLLVTDAGHAWVQAFDPKSGAFLARFGGKGEGDANLEKPEGIAVDGDGNIFIADYTTGFVVKYDADFKYVLTFGGYGAGKGEIVGLRFGDGCAASGGRARVIADALSGDGAREENRDQQNRTQSRRHDQGTVYRHARPPERPRLAPERHQWQ